MNTEIIEHTTGKLYHSSPNESNKKIAIWSQQEYGKVLIGTLDNTMYQAEANAERIVTAWNEYDKLKAKNAALEKRNNELHSALNIALDNWKISKDTDGDFLPDEYQLYLSCTNIISNSGH